MAVKYWFIVLVVLFVNGYSTLIKPRNNVRVPSNYVEYYTEPNPEIVIPVMIHLDKAMTRQVPKNKGSKRKLKFSPATVLKEAEEVFKRLDKRVRLKLLNVKTLSNSTFKIDDNISTYLNNYCTWQKNVKEKNGEPYFSVLLTGLDLYYINKNGKKVGRGTGRGYMTKICSMNKSCAILKWHKTDLAYLLAHEIAHSMGIRHDGYKNNCKSGFIMTTQYERQKLPKQWSSCSKTMLLKFLSNKRKSWCVTTNY